MLPRLLCGLLAIAGIGASTSACAVEDATDDPIADDTHEVKVDTSTPAARAQYDANVAFARAYTARCVVPDDGAPRVLVTGYGRFGGITTNATGKIVSALVPAARYPETSPAPPGEVDPPDAQVSVGVTTLELPDVGRVHVCGMVLPVSWDLAAILVSREVAAIEPNLVIMNGVARSRQPLWLELGAVNEASGDDSSGLEPSMPRGQFRAKIIGNAATSEHSRGNLLAWDAVRAAVDAARDAQARDVEGPSVFGDVLQGGAVYARFPRANTYLCNNVTYVTGYLMDHPERTVRLLQASTPVRGKPNDVRVRLGVDMSRTARVFFHWPSGLAEHHHGAGAAVLRAAIGAQLAATARGESVRGDAMTPTPGGP
jgi:pyrrolidone-carboxylate peptidase